MQIKRVVRQTIDESHPGVKDMIDAGYDPQDCVEAIEQSLGNVQEAMKMLDAREMEEGAEPGLFVRSTSREDTMQSQYVFCCRFEHNYIHIDINCLFYFPEMSALSPKKKILLSCVLLLVANS